jgi:enoyl-CoA hydratase/carnithine racemase
MASESPPPIPPSGPPAAPAGASPWAEDGGVEVRYDGPVAILALARPPGNGWTPALGRRFYAEFDRLASEPHVRAVVVTGDGPDFCVGGDGSSLNNVADAASYEAISARPDYWMPMAVGKPVIAAVNGACFGVGMQLALFCDVRIAAASAKFSTAFVRRGLIAELGMTWVLPRMVGLGVANDLLLSGRVVRPDEALRLGLVNQVVADEDVVSAAVDYGRTLAEKCSPAAMAVVKRQTYVDLTSELVPAITRSDEYMRQALHSADFAEGVRSWREERPARFAPLPAELARYALPGTDLPVAAR